MYSVINLIWSGITFDQSYVNWHLNPNGVMLNYISYRVEFNINRINNVNDGSLYSWTHVKL